VFHDVWRRARIYDERSARSGRPHRKAQTCCRLRIAQKIWSRPICERRACETPGVWSETGCTCVLITSMRDQRAGVGASAPRLRRTP
jgi:hypothetical protein